MYEISGNMKGADIFVYLQEWLCVISFLVSREPLNSQELTVIIYFFCYFIDIWLAVFNDFPPLPIPSYSDEIKFLQSRHQKCFNDK